VGIGYVPEERRIFPNLTVVENLRMGIKHGKTTKSESSNLWTFERIFKHFPFMQERTHQKGALLSGGEQQMLAIGRTLMGNPRAILLDEPSEGLAPIIVEHMAAAIRALKADGLCVVLSEQNLHFARQVGDRACLLEQGRSETAEAAALFYYLNRTGYNGLCRFNSRGVFNVPFGRYRRIGYVTDYSAYREAFSAWTFMTGDAEAIPIERGDFIYADPPYDVEFTHYATGGFSWEDQQRTAVWLAKHRGPVILVNQATDRVEKLYRKLGFAVNFLSGPRRISCTGDRAPAREIIGTRHL